MAIYPLDHKDAWNVANHRREESNLARCYIELREAAAKVVEQYYVASGLVPIDGQDGYDPIRALRLICETADGAFEKWDRTRQKSSSTAA